MDKQTPETPQAPATDHDRSTSMVTIGTSTPLPSIAKPRVSMNNIKFTRKVIPAVTGLVIILALIVIYAIWHFSTASNPRVTITYVNMPGLADYQAGNIRGTYEAQGNYIYTDESSNNICTDCARPYWGKGTVVYDGKTVYSGDLDGESILLSNNGLHYVYGVPNANDTAESYYLDNRHLNQSASFILGSQVVALSSNGKDYAYSNRSGLYVDTSIKYTPTITGGPTPSFGQPVFSSDLSDYITSVTVNQESTKKLTETVAYDGKTLASASELGSAVFDMSDNGRHYIYATNEVLDHDGKNIAIPKNEFVNQVQITDNGSYTYIECGITNGESTIYIGSHAYTNGTCDSAASVSVLISATGNHYLYFKNDVPNDKAVLDGKPITLSGNINSADFVGNTLYVYRWTN